MEGKIGIRIRILPSVLFLTEPSEQSLFLTDLLNARDGVKETSTDVKKYDAATCRTQGRT